MPITNNIKPELAAGFRDYLPEDMIPRNAMLKKIKAVFERFGFVPIDTPALERSEVIGSEDSDFLIYRTGISSWESIPGSEKPNLALRYDLTVPLARFYAANVDKLPKPFKRYQFGRVWRGEKAQMAKGRWREFTQLDIDIVGSDSSMADAEIVAVMYETLKELDLGGNFVIKVNNRKILKDIPSDVLREIDKLDKIGWGNLSKDAQKYKDFFSQTRTNTELDVLLANTEALGVPKESIQIDNTIIRGLSYYTGNIFEAVILNMPEFGSVFSGGRYDNLVDRFAPFSVPAVGASVGVDRIFTALDELGLLTRTKNTAKILVLNFEPSCAEFVQKTVTTLRKNSIPAELYFGQEDTLKGQLAYAVKREYPLVLIVGAEEKERNVLQLKNMLARTQNEIALDSLVSAVRSCL